MVFFFLFGLYSVEMGGSIFPLEDGHSGSLEEFSDPDFEELQKETKDCYKIYFKDTVTMVIPRIYMYIQ